LLPGHIKLAEYEVTLGIAQELSGSIVTLKNLPGSFNYLLNKTAEKYNADYILIDLSPSLSSINQNLLMISDYFIVPTSPDYYSVMAIDSLTTIIKKWIQWSKQAQGLPILKQAEYPYPVVTPKFLGSIIQKFRLRGGGPSKGFQFWVDEINKSITDKFVNELRTHNMMLPDKVYKSRDLIQNKYCLSNIPDFNTLIATSQEAQTPVFALNSDHIKQAGVVLNISLSNVKKFHKLFKKIAEDVIGLIELG